MVRNKRNHESPCSTYYNNNVLLDLHCTTSLRDNYILLLFCDINILCIMGVNGVTQLNY